MDNPAEYIRSLIKKAGGDAAVSLACSLRPGSTKKWSRIGIHENHWPVLRELTAATVEELHAANQALRYQMRTKECCDDDHH